MIVSVDVIAEENTSCSVNFDFRADKFYLWVFYKVFFFLLSNSRPDHVHLVEMKNVGSEREAPEHRSDTPPRQEVKIFTVSSLKL